MHLRHGLAGLANNQTHHQPLASQPSSISAAIFLHTTWRSGGTWLWSRLCRASNTLGFYEPLHEGLATMSRADLEQCRPDRWSSGHTELIKGSYFEAYKTHVRDSGGIQSFPQDFDLSNFFAEDWSSCASLQPYLDELLGQDDGRIKVFKFCRSAGLLGVLEPQYPLVRHIVLMRNPLSQWVSIRKQAVLYQNRYFIDRIGLILNANRRRPVVAAALDALGLATGASYSEDEQGYRAFLAFWLLVHSRIPDQTDAILHVDLLGASSSYRSAVERQLQQLTGLTVDLADAQQEATSLDAVWMGLEPDSALRCHADALRYVAAMVSDGHLSSRLSALLSFASLRSTDHGVLLHCASADEVILLDRVMMRTQRLSNQLGVARTTALAAEQRAEQAERRLAQIEHSLCWSMTSPLRRFGITVKRFVGPAREGSLLGERTEAKQ